MIKKLGSLVLTAFFLCVGVPQAQAQDVWVLRTDGDEQGPERNIPDDYYVDTSTIQWNGNNEFSVKLKRVLSTGKYTGSTSFHFYRLDDLGLWMYHIGNIGKIPSKNHQSALRDSWGQPILDICLCEKAAANDFKPNTNDKGFKAIKQRLDKIVGTLYDPDGNSVTIKDMTINGYPIIEAFDFVGGDPGGATIIIRQPNGCRAARISWMSHPMENLLPYFEIDDVRYQYL